MEEELTVDVLCLFCQQPLTGEKNRVYQSGDQIKCNQCGKLNDYDSVIEAAQKTAVELVKSRTDGELTITTDKLSKK